MYWNKTHQNPQPTKQDLTRFHQKICCSLKKIFLNYKASNETKQMLLLIKFKKQKNIYKKEKRRKWMSKEESPEHELILWGMGILFGRGLGGGTLRGWGSGGA